MMAHGSQDVRMSDAAPGVHQQCPTGRQGFNVRQPRSIGAVLSQEEDDNGLEQVIANGRKKNPVLGQAGLPLR